MISRSLLRQAQIFTKTSKFQGLAHHGLYNFSNKFSDRLNNIRTQQEKPSINVDIPQGSAAQQVLQHAGLNQFVTRV